VVTLDPLTDADRAAALALRVAPHQERFVSSVADALREAAEHPAAHATCWVIRADGGVVVGFAMLVDEVDDPAYLPHYLWKLLIDARHQRRGHGTAALDRIAARFRALGAPALTTSAHIGEDGPVAFYERHGFVRVGEAEGDEVLLRLALG
jgi:diamine N-acetyltransferase